MHQQIETEENDGLDDHGNNIPTQIVPFEEIPSVFESWKQVKHFWRTNILFRFKYLLSQIVSPGSRPVPCRSIPFRGNNAGISGTRYWRCCRRNLNPVQRPMNETGSGDVNRCLPLHWIVAERTMWSSWRPQRTNWGRTNWQRPSWILRKINLTGTWAGWLKDLTIRLTIRTSSARLIASYP